MSDALEATKAFRNGIKGEKDWFEKAARNELMHSPRMAAGAGAAGILTMTQLYNALASIPKVQLGSNYASMVSLGEDIEVAQKHANAAVESILSDHAFMKGQIKDQPVYY